MPKETGNMLMDTSRFWEPIRNGDPDALCDLFDNYSSLLYSFARRIGAKEEEVYDLIQEVFADLWESRARLPKEIRTKAYLFRILRNKLYDTYKLSQRFIKEPFPEIMDQALSVEDAWINQETSSDQHQQLQRLLAQLPERQRELLLLKFVHGFTYEEMAEITGLQYQSIRNTIHKALTRLRNWVIFWIAFFLLEI